MKKIKHIYQATGEAAFSKELEGVCICLVDAEKVGTDVAVRFLDVRKSDARIVLLAEKDPLEAKKVQLNGLTLDDIRTVSKEAFTKIHIARIAWPTVQDLQGKKVSRYKATDKKKSGFRLTSK